MTEGNPPGRQSAASPPDNGSKMKVTLRTLSVLVVAVSIVTGALLAGGVVLTKRAIDDQRVAAERQAEHRKLGIQLADESDLLTNEARKLVVTGDRQHEELYWKAIEETKTGEHVLARLKQLRAPAAEFDLIALAKKNSDDLVATETRATRLVNDALAIPESKMHPAIADWKPSAADQAMTAEQKLTAARRIMFDSTYEANVAIIKEPIARFQRAMDARLAHEVAGAEHQAGRAITLLIALVVLLMGVLAALAWLVRRIARRVEPMVAAADAIAAGDVDQHVNPHGRDEIAAMGGAMQRTIAYLHDMTAHAERIADGDLTVEIEPRSERDALGNAFVTMVTNLRALVGKVSTTATALSASSVQMATSSQEAGRAVGEIASAVSDVAQGAERQVRVVESARDAAQHVSTAVTESADNATQTSQVAEQARELAQHGVDAAQSASDAMQSVRDSSGQVAGAIRDLASKSEQIGGIVATITGIAEQTNLLALNAAIEAARAGEQGRGFAVVAEEVRKLAEESQTAAASIAGLIGQIQGDTLNAVKVVEDGARRTEDGVATVAQTRDAFERIGESVQDMSGRIEKIADAAQRIAGSAARMHEEIGEVAGVAEESSASAEQVSASTAADLGFHPGDRRFRRGAGEFRAAAGAARRRVHARVGGALLAAGEPGGVEHLDPPPPQRDLAARLRLAQHPVDGRARRAGEVGELLLRQRHDVAVVGELGHAPPHAGVGGLVVRLDQQLGQAPHAQRERGREDVRDRRVALAQRVEVELVDRARLALLDRDHGGAARRGVVEQRDLAEALARPDQAEHHGVAERRVDPHRVAPGVHEVQRVRRVAAVEDDLTTPEDAPAGDLEHPPRVVFGDPGEDRPLHAPGRYTAGASSSVRGTSRSSQRGIHQLRSPSSCITAGTSTSRTIVASTSTAVASPARSASGRPRGTAPGRRRRRP